MPVSTRSLMVEPQYESNRLEALRQYHIMDTEVEQPFDDFTSLAANICRTPIALLTLLDGERQWFKSALGVNVRQIPREQAFCTYTIREPETLVVYNALVDERFSRNPWVTGELHVRFYAGSPLINREGYAIGTLCVIDAEPRRLAPSDLAALDALSRSAIALIEARRIARLLVEANEALEHEMRARQRADKQKSLLIRALKGDESSLKVLRGFIPICSYCKGIRDEEGSWHEMEEYITRNSEAEFSHGICPGCFEREIDAVA